MNIAILTTKTIHHAFFVYQIKKKFDTTDVFLEKKKKFSKFKISHPIDQKINIYEKKKCFKNSMSFLSKFKKNKEIKNFNSNMFLEKLKKKNYDLVIVFGAGIIGSKLINQYKKKIFNLHGGDPQSYRGLDSLLWSIFNNDFKKIVTTLHLLERKVDTGKIYKIKKIFLKKNMKYYELRYYNTLNCIQLTEKLIFEIIRNKKIKLKSQKIQGRYYTAMPSSLKDYCIKKFENYTVGL